MVIRDWNDLNQLIDYSESIVERPQVTGFLKSLNLFKPKGITTLATTFEVKSGEVNMLSSTSRRERNTTVGSDSRGEIFAVRTAYFKHSDRIIPEDLQGIRDFGTPDGVKTLAKVTQEKLQGLRDAVDMTHEYMMLEAAKGRSVTPDGDILWDAFSTMGVTQEVFDWDLGNPVISVRQKTSELKRYLQANMRGTGVIRGVLVICGQEFFDSLILHPSVRETYLNWQQAADYRNANDTYQEWGVVDRFDWNGISFVTYPATFYLPDGTPVEAVGPKEALVIPMANDVFRGAWAPSNKLSQVNTPGKEMYAWQRMVDDEALELQVETAPLFYSAKPRLLPRVHTSTIAAALEP